MTALPHTTDDPVVNVYGGDVMIAYTTPEEQLAAWIFVKHFTSPEVQAQWLSISNYFPTRAGTGPLMGEFIAESSFGAQYESALDLLQYGAYEPQLISYQAVRDAAEETFNAVLQGADTQEALDELTELANELQAELMEEIGE